MSAAETIDRKIASQGGTEAVLERLLPLRALCVHDLATHRFKPRTPLLEPFLATQDLAMVFAGRGIGKTHLALAISYTIATGGELFGRWRAPQARKVLFLDGELPGGVLQQRLMLHLPEREPEPGLLRVFTPDLLPDGVPLPDLGTLEGQEAIEPLIEPDTALVVVDNLSAWVRFGRENEAESWHPVGDWCLRLRRRGIAVLLIHHAGKGGQQRGTSKREDLLDVVLGLSRPKDYDARKGANFIIEFSKARHLAGDAAQSLEVELHAENERASWTCSTVADSTYDRVVALHKDGLRPTEIAAELEVNKSQVSRHLARARAARLVK